MKLCACLDRSVFAPSPESGTAVHAASFYTHPTLPRLTSVSNYEQRSDTIEVAYLRYSEDNGRTWSEPETFACAFDSPEGMGRRHFRGFYADPASGRTIALWTEGVLPNDDPLEGIRRWTLNYAVLEDDGRTFAHRGQIIHQGDDYDAIHHMPGITVGKNSLMMGDLGERPFTRSDGAILVPAQSSPTGPDGTYHNPGAGYTYTDCVVLMGSWQADGTLSWRCSERVAGDPERTTRGMIEPTLAELPDGRLLMVMRGSNDARHELPGYRWHSFSEDGGESWSPPRPWHYTNSERFFSPSSCSQLLPWSDGRLFWIGNICPENPYGNSPRYPIVLAEVDLDSGMVKPTTVTALDDRAADESPRLTLSNFYAREDRQSGELLLHMTRLFARQQPDAPTDWTADAMLMRYQLHG